MKTFIFLNEAGQEMEESYEFWEPSGTQNDVLLGARPPPHWMWLWDHPPLNVIVRGPRSKISAMGPEFLATALRAITVSGPSTVYHLVFTPYSPFLTVTRLKSVSPHGAPHKHVPVLQALWWYLQGPISGLYLPYQKNFPRFELWNHPLWCGWELVAKSSRHVS